MNSTQRNHGEIKYFADTQVDLKTYVHWETIASAGDGKIDEIVHPGKNPDAKPDGRPDIKPGTTIIKKISGDFYEVRGSALLGAKVEKILGAHLYKITFSASIDIPKDFVELTKVRVQWGFTGRRQAKEFFPTGYSKGKIISGTGYLDAFEARDQALTPHSIEFYLKALGARYLEISDGYFWKPPPAFALFRAEFMPHFV